MRPTHLVLGVLLLLIAAAVAVYTSDGSGESAASHNPHRDNGSPSRNPGARRPASADLHRPLSTSLPSIGGHLPVIDSLHVEPFGIDHPAVAAQAARIETGALDRLEEMIDELGLTPQQQLDIFPLLARSHPDYSAAVRLVGVRNGPLDPLGRLAARKQIYKLLDPDQQLDLELNAIDAEAWWTDTIARLEQDLRDATPAPLAGNAPPDHDPTPPKDDPPPPAAVAPATPHRANNLFDLLEEGGS